MTFSAWKWPNQPNSWQQCVWNKVLLSSFSSPLSIERQPCFCVTSHNTYNYWPTDHPKYIHENTHTAMSDHTQTWAGSCAGKLFLLLPSPLAGSLPHVSLSLPFVLCAGFREQWKCYSLLPSLAQFPPFSLSYFPLSQPLSKISCPYFSLPLSGSFFLFLFTSISFSLSLSH